MKKRTALVAGASGLVGSELLQQLLEDPEYERVTALVRSTLPIKHPKLTERIIDFGKLGECKEYFSADDIYCCLGTTIKKAKTREAFRQVDYEYPLTMAKLAESSGAGNYLIVTAIGSSASSSIFYSRVKGELEEALQQLSLPSLHIFRPSFLLGRRQEFRLGERFFGMTVMKWLKFVWVGRLRKYRPIEGRQVAQAMIAAAKSGRKGLQIYEGGQM